MFIGWDVVELAVQAAAWLAAAPFSKVTPFFSLKAMKSVVAWLIAQCAWRAR